VRTSSSVALPHTPHADDAANARGAGRTIPAAPGSPRTSRVLGSSAQCAIDRIAAKSRAMPSVTRNPAAHGDM
jgi:hypothetical protein